MWNTNFISLVNVWKTVWTEIFAVVVIFVISKKSELELVLNNNIMGKGDGNKNVVLTDAKKISQFILLWEGEDLLYVTTHVDYHNNNKWLAALIRVFFVPLE